MRREIGSNFYDIEISLIENNLIRETALLTLSGRVALDIIIRDILKNNKQVKKVAFPSYCCVSMIEPFETYGATIDFYDVTLKDKNGFYYNIDISKRYDAVFIMQYFGYEDLKIDEIIDVCKKNGAITIEDVTHSLFVRDIEKSRADYVFGSLRKWTGLYSGGFCLKKNGELNIPVLKDVPDEYIFLAESLMRKKKCCLKSGVDSDLFLQFQLLEEKLGKYHKCYRIDRVSENVIKKLDIDFIKHARRDNAKLLLRYIKNMKMIRPIYNVLNGNDVPLFFPIIVSNSRRNDLRDYLIENRIYCPNHWPISGYFDFFSEKAKFIYDNQLSLVCDQRYDSSDMMRMIYCLIEFESRCCQC